MKYEWIVFEKVKQAVKEVADKLGKIFLHCKKCKSLSWTLLLIQLTDFYTHGENPDIHWTKTSCQIKKCFGYFLIY